MVNEYVSNPKDPTQEIFSWLEKHALDINHIINLLMVALSINLQIFKEYGGSNAKEKSQEGIRDREEIKNQAMKQPRKYKLGSSVLNQSQ